jgi:hypothetical protein
MPDFDNLQALAEHLRDELTTKRCVLIYAYNGIGKTRLSTEFKNLGKAINAEGETTNQDTLYFNAFTEDLFSWDNDLTNDRIRTMKINSDSRFFAGLGELEMDNRIRPLLHRYADFDFRIDTIDWKISFSRTVEIAGVTATVEDIKISRGEENIFIWCFFLAIIQLTLDEAEAYAWVKNIYIDDPISSLDEHNAVTVANHLAQMLKGAPDRIRMVVSSHHVLFFNVLCNEMRGSRKYFLNRRRQAGGLTYSVEQTDSTPFLYHLASLVEMHQAERDGALFTHHFNMLRRVMEQTACFFGYDNWYDCIVPEADDPNGTTYKRRIDLMSHGDYSLYEPKTMMPENREHFAVLLRQFITHHPFSPALFSGDVQE